MTQTGFLRNYRGEIRVASKSAVAEEIQWRRLHGKSFDDIVELNKHLIANCKVKEETGKEEEE